MLREWIKKRAFEQVRQGVLIAGDNENGARRKVDGIKVKQTSSTYLK